jgi:hypothetical protein
LHCSVPAYVPEGGARLEYLWKRTGGFDRGRRRARQPQVSNDGGYLMLGAANVLVNG